MSNRNLSAKQFSKMFKPSEYGKTWEEVSKNKLFHEIAEDEANFSHKDMIESLKKSGMQTPVQVQKGYVIDGHHRVTAAIDANVPIKFEEVKKE